MKKLRTLFLITIITQQLFCQIDKATINLNDSIKLTMYRSTFDTSGKQIDCYENKWPYAIDGKPLYGTDGTIPKYVLSSACLTIGQKKYELQVDNMYNPWFGEKPFEKLFKIKIDGTEIKLRGFFSDAAGAYGAEWLIIGQSNIRSIITKDEWLLFEYFGFK